ncbi:type II toxin-antitoxin system death-on-curing family toxin [Paenibacillus sp. TRM 82003]|uniref:type II toxin-antitoxin system death-on-curing family toxin n=1 Tax=Kineococcus sp. TRM81007 TaxID=2925831 RepID=UPI001F55ED64|nr:type II toxin-antitoxin system death-on-curing family toxin [Kineococcus sp. TRM81007]MCI2236965.1 type II toxin-antitoxin system death-on-curing family toxin [Kineococcus sp. TRM81007]MCI3926376.1 type II toxin-antitoxin system death-on-curing family toxin [Paenibacillus sp. TRM 82003]
MTEPHPPIDHLTTEDLLEIAAGVVEDVQVHDLGLLASAAARPRTTVFGREAYPDLAEKTAALMHSLARNHPLVDGNKRLAWSAARVFCLLNGTDLVMDVDDAEQMVLAVAAGDLDATELAEVINRHLR